MKSSEIKIADVLFDYQKYQYDGLSETPFNESLKPERRK